MFELSLSNDVTSNFLIKPDYRRFFDANLHEKVAYSDENIVINGIKYKGEKDGFFETKEYVIFISGKIYYQLSVSKQVTPLGAAEVLDLYVNENLKFSDKLKGNFIILIYSKASTTFLILKDQLGLKYLYYKQDKKYFYISTNLNDFKEIDFQINYCTILEKIIFNYPISNNSLIKDVYMLEQGQVLDCYNSLINIKPYFEVAELFPKTERLEKFDEAKFLNLFEHSVLQRAAVSENISASLTGGFDGRANVAVLLKNKIKFQAYSFGKSGGENTTVPLKASEKVGINYTPIYLDSEFEKEYTSCVMEVCNLSDGISIFERANYIYAAKKTAKSSRYIITGLIGGEVFAPVHQKTDYINENYYNVMYDQKALDIPKFISENPAVKFMNPEFFLTPEIINELSEHIKKRRSVVQKYKQGNFGWMYYMKDLITVGFPHFYGNQMHLERYYTENLSPFYDLDLLKYIFSTTHLNVYKNAFKNSVLLRRGNRKLQSLIIKKFYPALGELDVDRGYPPNYNLDYRKALIPYYFYKRRRNNKKTSPDFDSRSWSEIFFKEIGNTIEFDERISRSKNIEDHLIKYNKSEYSQAFNSFFSILIWCSEQKALQRK